MTDYSGEALPAAKKKMQIKPIVQVGAGNASKYMTLWSMAIMRVIFRRLISV
jgi:hypothetical protein